MLGGGIDLGRMALLSSGGLGQGMTDVVFTAFILDALRQYGASKLVAFSSLALGSVASIVCAPLAGALSGRSVRMRKYTTLVCQTIAATAALAIGIIVGNHSVTTDGPRQESARTVAILIALAAVYRAATQAAPIVPMCIDAASHKVKGEAETSDARISICLSLFYLNYRLGFLVSSTVLAAMPKRDVDRLLAPFVGAAIVFYATIAVTSVAMPAGRIDADGQAKDVEGGGAAAPAPAPAPAPPPRSATAVAVDDVRQALFRAAPRLKFVYLETLMYGVGFGSLAAVTAPFYNEVIFGAPPGGSKGVAWAAYSGLISFAVGVTHDAVIGGLAFAAVLLRFGMTLFWVGELLVGAGLFAALCFVTGKYAALGLFGALALSSSAHDFFSLAAGGALVAEPRLRPAAFGVRASCLHLGWLVGSAAAAAASSGPRGFRGAMAVSAVATLAAAGAAAAVGTVDRPRFSGVAVNANPLVKWAARREAAFEGEVADGR